ncbi:MAG: serine/threonine protein phosphatase, partial [Rhodobacteraceae bacterium]|nr:serine/threonine protein phosphatase [Paracoccaceae bacterium]
MIDLTEGQRLYAIGDVHGRLDLLEAVLERVRADLARRPHPRPRVICLGDYVDRGPDSRGVIETLIALRGSNLAADFLLGNHDSYVEEYLARPDWYDRTYHWLHSSMGGAATLASYGVADASETRPEATRDAFAAALPPAHRAFLRDCALWRRVGGYVFVHAGIRPGVALEAQTRDDCIWIREPFLSATGDFGFKVVHGHTIVERVEHRANRIAIDTGAAKGGPLTCLVLEGADVALLEPGGLRRWPE